MFSLLLETRLLIYVLFFVILLFLFFIIILSVLFNVFFDHWKSLDFADYVIPRLKMLHCLPMISRSRTNDTNIIL